MDPSPRLHGPEPAFAGGPLVGRWWAETLTAKSGRVVGAVIGAGASVAAAGAAGGWTSAAVLGAQPALAAVAAMVVGLGAGVPAVVVTMRGGAARVARVPVWYRDLVRRLDALAVAAAEADDNGHVLSALADLRDRADDVSSREVVIDMAHEELINTHPAAFTYRFRTGPDGTAMSGVLDGPPREADPSLVWVDADARAFIADQRAELAAAGAAVTVEVDALLAEVSVLEEATRQRARLAVIGAQAPEGALLDWARDAVAGLSTPQVRAERAASVAAYAESIESVVDAAEQANGPGRSAAGYPMVPNVATS